MSNRGQRGINYSTRIQRVNSLADAYENLRERHLALVRTMRSKSITPVVDNRQVKELDAEYKRLMARHTAVQRLLNNNKITIRADRSELNDVFQNLEKIQTRVVSLQRLFNANPLTPRTANRELLETERIYVRLFERRHQGFQRYMNQSPLRPRVNPIELHELNDLFELKKAHHKELQAHFDRYPLIPRVDTLEFNSVEERIRKLRSVRDIKVRLTPIYPETPPEFNTGRMKSPRGGGGGSGGAVPTSINVRPEIPPNLLDDVASIASNTRSMASDTRKILANTRKLDDNTKTGMLTRLASFVQSGANLFGIDDEKLADIGRKAAFQYAESSGISEAVYYLVSKVIPKKVLDAILAETPAETLERAAKLSADKLGKATREGVRASRYKLGESIAAGLDAQVKEEDNFAKGFWKELTKKEKKPETKEKDLETESGETEKPEQKQPMTPKEMAQWVAQKIVPKVGEIVTDARRQTIEEHSINLVQQRVQEILENTTDEDILKRLGEIDAEQNIDTVVITVGGLAPDGGKSGLDYAKVLEDEGVLPENAVAVGLRNPDTALPVIENVAPEDLVKERAMILAKHLLRGYNKDAVELAAQILAAKQKNENLQFKMVGFSAGGYVVEEAQEILRMMGIKDTDFISVGTPNTEGSFSYAGKKILSGDEILGQLVEKYAQPWGFSRRTREQGIVGIKEHSLAPYVQQRIPKLINFLQDKAEPLEESDWEGLKTTASEMQSIDMDTADVDTLENIATQAYANLMLILSQFDVATEDTIKQIEEYADTFESIYIKSQTYLREDDKTFRQQVISLEKDIGNVESLDENKKKKQYQVMLKRLERMAKNYQEENKDVTGTEQKIVEQNLEEADKLYKEVQKRAGKRKQRSLYKKRPKPYTETPLRPKVEMPLKEMATSDQNATMPADDNDDISDPWETAQRTPPSRPRSSNTPSSPIRNNTQQPDWATRLPDFGAIPSSEDATRESLLGDDIRNFFNSDRIQPIIDSLTSAEQLETVLEQVKRVYAEFAEIVQKQGIEASQDYAGTSIGLFSRAKREIEPFADTLDPKVVRGFKGNISQKQSHILAMIGTGGERQPSELKGIDYQRAKIQGFQKLSERFPTVFNQENDVFLNSIKDALKQAEALFEEIGRQIPAGFAAGIGEEGDFVLETAARILAKQPLSEIKAEWGIASPSKKAQEIAQNILNSFVNTVKSGSQQIQKAYATTFKSPQQLEEQEKGKDKKPGLMDTVRNVGKSAKKAWADYQEEKEEEEKRRKANKPSIKDKAGDVNKKLQKTLIPELDEPVLDIYREIDKVTNSVKQLYAGLEKLGPAGKIAKGALDAIIDNMVGISTIAVGSVLVFGFIKTLTGILENVIDMTREIMDTFQTLQSIEIISKGRGKDASIELEFVDEMAQKTASSLNAVAKGYRTFINAVEGTKLEGKGKEIFESVSLAVSAMGMGQNEMEGALTAINQMIGKGRVSLEELTGQLGERLPGALQIAARSMGLTTRELVNLVEQGGLAAEDFLPKFAEALKATAIPISIEFDHSFHKTIGAYNLEVERLQQNFVKGGIEEFTLFTQAMTQVMRFINAAADEIGAIFNTVATIIALRLTSKFGALLKTIMNFLEKTKLLRTVIEQVFGPFFLKRLGLMLAVSVSLVLMMKALTNQATRAAQQIKNLQELAKRQQDSKTEKTETLSFFDLGLDEKIIYIWDTIVERYRGFANKLVSIFTPVVNAVNGLIDAMARLIPFGDKIVSVFKQVRSGISNALPPILLLNSMRKLVTLTEKKEIDETITEDRLQQALYRATATGREAIKGTNEQVQKGIEYQKQIAQMQAERNRLAEAGDSVGARSAQDAIDQFTNRKEVKAALQEITDIRQQYDYAITNAKEARDRVQKQLNMGIDQLGRPLKKEQIIRMEADVEEYTTAINTLEKELKEFNEMVGSEPKVFKDFLRQTEWFLIGINRALEEIDTIKNRALDSATLKETSLLADLEEMTDIRVESVRSSEREKLEFTRARINAEIEAERIALQETRAILEKEKQMALELAEAYQAAVDAGADENTRSSLFTQSENARKSVLEREATIRQSEIRLEDLRRQHAENEKQRLEQEREERLRAINLQQTAMERAHNARMSQIESQTKALQKQEDAIQAQISALQEYARSIELDRAAVEKLYQKQINEAKGKHQKEALEKDLRNKQAQFLEKELAIKKQILELEIQRERIAARRAQIESQKGLLQAELEYNKAQLELQKARESGDKEQIAQAQAQLENAKQAVSLAREDVSLASQQVAQVDQMAKIKRENFEKEARNARMEYEETADTAAEMSKIMEQVNSQMAKTGMLASSIGASFEHTTTGLADMEKGIGNANSGLQDMSDLTNTINTGITNMIGKADGFSSKIQSGVGQLKTMNAQLEKGVELWGKLTGGGGLGNTLGKDTFREGLESNQQTGGGSNGFGNLLGRENFREINGLSYSEAAKESKAAQASSSVGQSKVSQITNYNNHQKTVNNTFNFHGTTPTREEMRDIKFEMMRILNGGA